MQRYLATGLVLATLAAAGCAAPTAPEAAQAPGAETAKTVLQQNPIQPARAMSLFATIEGSVQGLIEGSSGIPGHEKKVKVEGLQTEVALPLSPDTGLPTGRRQHRPLKLIKMLDKASPKLFQAMVTGETLTKATFEYYRISPRGTMERYYTLSFRNLVVTSYKTFMDGMDWTAFVNIGPGHMEEVSMMFEHVTVTHDFDGIVAEDDVVAPKL